MKKITILANTLSYGHVEKHILSICMMLEEEYEIEIVSLFKIHPKPVFPFSDKIKLSYLVGHGPSNALMSNYWKEDNIFLRFREYLKSLGERKHLADLIIKKVKSIDSDYIICASGFPSNLVSKYAKPGIVKIATEESFYHEPSDLKNVLNWIKDFDYFVVPCTESYNYFKSKFSKVKCVHIPNVLDEVPRCHSDLTSNELVTMGRLTTDKRFDQLLEVVKIVKESIPDIKLNIIGDGIINEDLIKMYKDMGLDGNIVMHGYLKLPAMDRVMCGSSLYISAAPNRIDGVSMLEAMSQGVPVMLFKGPVGSEELVTHENLKIKNRDSNAMASEIVRLFNNREELETIGNDVFERSKNHMASKIKKHWLDILK